MVRKCDGKKTCLLGSILAIFQETLVVYQQPTRRFQNLLRRGYSLAPFHDFLSENLRSSQCFKVVINLEKESCQNEAFFVFRHVSLAAKDCFSLGGRVSRELCCSLHLNGSVTMRWQRSEPEKKGGDPSTWQKVGENICKFLAMTLPSLPSLNVPLIFAELAMPLQNLSFGTPQSREARVYG